MGCLALVNFVSSRRRRRTKLSHRQILRDGGSVASRDKGKDLQCEDGESSQVDKGIGSDFYLPEDILQHIHSLMPMQEAARAACVSRTFLRSWRCHPSLTFSEEIFGLNKDWATEDNATCSIIKMAERCLRHDITRDFINKINYILQNHAGIGVKALKLDLSCCPHIDSCRLDGWLHIAVTPGIEELTLMCFGIIKSPIYDFPCSLLSDRGGNSIRYLHLSDCAFCPTVNLGCFTSLTQLNLSFVQITGDELGIFLSKSLALELLSLCNCDEIMSLKIPRLLQRLSKLQVAECECLQAIESYAPNLSTFNFNGHPVQISFGNPVPVKDLEMSFMYQFNVVSYARTNLWTMVPNVEALTIHSRHEIDSTPMVPGKFPRLKYLHVRFDSVASSPAYDYLSLVSFLDASPSLETFNLSTLHPRAEHDSVFGEPFHPRQMPEYRHESLKSVKINGFCSARSMVELACHILENAPSLECLMLDTTSGAARCYLGKSDKCTEMRVNDIMEAHRGLLAARTYISGKVPPAVKLSVVGPCSRCHAVKIQDAKTS